MDIFNVCIEFNHHIFRDRIYDAISKKHPGYICVIDGNVISRAQSDPYYNKIIKEAYVNTCDSSFIAKMASDIYDEKFTAFTGPMVFSEFIEKPYHQLLLGNTEETYNNIKSKLKDNTGDDSTLSYIGLPFAKVEEFDYVAIANRVNEIKPDIIWVSLGAPKQEFFMSRLLPYIEQGLMFGIGAAFNYYSGKQAMTNASIGPYRLIWLQRIFQEPKKQLSRCWNFIKVIPSLRREELKKKNRKG